MIQDFFSLAVNNLRERKLRSWLTIIGIVIGVAAIIALISVSQGLNNSIEEQFNLLGADKIFVYPSGQGDPSFRSGLSNSDVEVLERLSKIEKIIPSLIINAEIEFAGEEKEHRIFGWPSEFMEDIETEFGSPLKEGVFPKRDTFSAVIGIKAAEELFDKEVRLRSKIIIEGRKFEVVGILAPIGTEDDDNAIYVPNKILQDITNHKNDITFITLQVKEGVNPSDTVKEVRKALARERGEDIRGGPDEFSFEVVTPDQILGQLNQILGIVQAVLVGIAAISLIVGAVGITNAMYTSVIQRTRTIGIMKSIGAQNKDILIVFVFESAIVGAVGGIIGDIMGTAIAFLVEVIASASGFIFLDVQVNFSLLLFGVVFALVIGVLAGFFPARHASRLSPVNAVRYE